MLATGSKTVGFILTVIQFCLNIFICITSLIVFIILIYNIQKNKIKREDQMGVKLCGHIYFALLLYSCLLISNSAQSMLGDIYCIDFDTFSCLIAGYLTLIAIYMLCMTFINQVKQKRKNENYSLYL